MKIRAFRLEDENAVTSLWQECGLARSWNDPVEDIERKLEHQREGFLVALEAGAIAGTVMAGYDGHRGWVNYLAVALGHRRKGYGRALMQAAEEYLRVAGAPKVNLQVRDGNDEARAFYKSLGYELEERVNFGKRLDSGGLDSNIQVGRGGKRLTGGSFVWRMLVACLGTFLVATLTYASDSVPLP